MLQEVPTEQSAASLDRMVGALDKADCVVVSDTSLYAPGQPSLIYGLKGLCYMEIKVTGPNRDLHSGTFGGADAVIMRLFEQRQATEVGMGEEQRRFGFDRRAAPQEAGGGADHRVTPAP